MAFQLTSTVVLVVDRMFIAEVDRELGLPIKDAMVGLVIVPDQRKVMAMAAAVAVLELLAVY